MLSPSNWILVLATLPYARHNETVLRFSVLHSDSPHAQDFNTNTLPTYTALTHRVFCKGTVFAGGSNQANLTEWTGYLKSNV